jgi:hypothetical protein
MSYYLAYGMNTNKKQMGRRCPKARSLGAVKLLGHKLAFKQFCDAVINHDSSMDCVLWDITPECEYALDLLEGYPDFYGKKEVTVQYNGRQIRAMIYFMTDHTGAGYPSEYYLNMVTEGYLEHGVNLAQIEQALEDVDAHCYGT